ncbi:hypothetical protein J4711_14420 [Staphylococcus epidermidis]|nr:hypothetical protein [Staphylococcus epidermidis]
MTVSNRLVIAFVSISVFVLALMGIAWSAMTDVLAALKTARWALSRRRRC